MTADIADMQISGQSEKGKAAAGMVAS